MKRKRRVRCHWRKAYNTQHTERKGMERGKWTKQQFFWIKRRRRGPGGWRWEREDQKGRLETNSCVGANGLWWIVSSWPASHTNTTKRNHKRWQHHAQNNSNGISQQRILRMDGMLFINCTTPLFILFISISICLLCLLSPRLSDALKAFITRFLFIFFPFLCFLSSPCHDCHVRVSHSSIASSLARVFPSTSTYHSPYTVCYVRPLLCSSIDFGPRRRPRDKPQRQSTQQRRRNEDEIPGQQNREKSGERICSSPE